MSASTLPFPVPQPVVLNRLRNASCHLGLSAQQSRHPCRRSAAVVTEIPAGQRRNRRCAPLRRYCHVPHTARRGRARKAKRNGTASDKERREATMYDAAETESGAERPSGDDRGDSVSHYPTQRSYCLCMSGVNLHGVGLARRNYSVMSNAL